MAEAFMGEIRLMTFNFAPKDWMSCDGQTLLISEYQALYSLLGTTYGGNGTTTFALPDLRGRVPMGAGDGYLRGQKSGSITHSLSVAELPVHTHVLMAATGAATTAVPGSGVLPARTPTSAYGPATWPTTGATGSVASTGTSAAHLNMQPFVVLRACICVGGDFPSSS